MAKALKWMTQSNKIKEINVLPVVFDPIPPLSGIESYLAVDIFVFGPPEGRLVDDPAEGRFAAADVEVLFPLEDGLVEYIAG